MAVNGYMPYVAEARAERPLDRCRWRDRLVGRPQARRGRGRPSVVSAWNRWWPRNTGQRRRRAMGSYCRSATSSPPATQMRMGARPWLGRSLRIDSKRPRTRSGQGSGL